MSTIPFKRNRGEHDDRGLLFPGLRTFCAFVTGWIISGIALLPIGLAEAQELEAETVKSVDETSEPPDDASESKTLVDRLEHKVMLWQTANGLDQGDVILTGYDGVIWLEGRVGLTDWLELDGYFSAPIFYALVGGSLRTHFPVGKNLRASIGASGGYTSYFPVQEDMNNDHLAYFGGSFELTGKYKKHLFNFSLAAHGFYTENPNCLGDYCYEEMDGPKKKLWPGAVVMSGLGYRYSLNDTWSLQAELLVTFYSRQKPREFFLPLFTWGARWHTEHFFGDLGLIAPIVEGYYEKGNTGQYLPLGLPYFSIGSMF